MPSRTAAEAVEHYRTSIQRTLTCVTRDVISLQGAPGRSPYDPGVDDHVMELGRPGVVRLTGAEQLSLRVLFRYQIGSTGEHGRGWDVTTRAYYYAVRDADRDEVVAYHWHPEGSGSVTDPHLHVGRAIVGPALQFGNRYIHRMHFPTSQVSLAAFIRLLIEEFGVRPLRDDWDAVLREHGDDYQDRGD